MGSHISIICCARLESEPCCHVEEEEPDDLLASPAESFKTLLLDT
jgi:hypothetical protein